MKSTYFAVKIMLLWLLPAAMIQTQPATNILILEGNKNVFPISLTTQSENGK
jgi:hypothetical protein